MKQLDGTGLKRLHREWRRRGHRRLALVLDSVQSPFNVGAIVRTAAAYRLDHVWITGTTPELSASGVGKVALGTERYLTWTSLPTASDAVAAARSLGYQVVAVELADDATPLHEIAVADAMCLVFGNEDHGLSANLLAEVDACAYLPQLGRVGSLNVATAAALAVYEIRRKDWQQASGASG
jgi:tRNA (guanosine-2'-O-)-methyltransferase